MGYVSITGWKRSGKELKSHEMNQQQRGDHLNRGNSNGLPAQREDIPENNSNSDFEDNAFQRNSRLTNGQDTGIGSTMPMEVDLTEDADSEIINSITQRLLSIYSVLGTQDNLDTTESHTQDAKVRRRTTDKWICMFQITGALEFQSLGEADISEITEDSEIAKIDKFLKGFFQTYNDNIKGLTKHNFKVNQALGSRYIYHARNKVLKGVLVVVGGNSLVENLRLNSHLLLEKFSPTSPLLYGKYHNVYIGHAYPIHTTDVVCSGGNCLRDLLKNWVDEKFYESLHWIIPSTSDQMRLMSPSSAKAKEEEDLLRYKNLISEMEEALREPRPSLEKPSMPSKRIPVSQSNSLFDYLDILPGQECSLHSHHWELIEVPLNSDNSVNDRVQRMVVKIKQKGGVIKRISQ